MTSVTYARDWVISNSLKKKEIKEKKKRKSLNRVTLKTTLNLQFFKIGFGE